MTANGPGRWSVNHFTLDGETALCGKRIPRSHECFRNDALIFDYCKKCQQRAKALETD